MRRIERLEQSVVDKIAAGEVVHRPANALKELLENSLDAGATQINVVVGQGGLKLLQISDDGCGIRREDLEIVCERFTTSKLRSFDDLNAISSYGFRGEALSSVSHVAHVTITSKTNDQPCAYRAHYRDGVLVAKTPGGSKDPVPCAGKTGTQIVEDMFYNLSTRKQALKNASEQYQRILEVVQRYALHYSGQNKAFVCKKHREVTCDVNIAHNMSQIDSIKTIYGPSIANEVAAVDFTDNTAMGNDSPVIVKGYVTNANYNTKKGTFVLFINNRLVDCPLLKRAIEHLYAQYLPKHSHPFVYLAMEIPPHNVDVNVHPTKREVHFLHEESIIQAVADHIDSLLKGGNESRVFTVQPIATMLSSHLTTRQISAASMKAKFSQESSLNSSFEEENSPKPKRISTSKPDLQESSPLVQVNLTKAKARTYSAAKAPQRLVRTDHKATTIDRFLVSQKSDTTFADEEETKLDIDSFVDEVHVTPPAKRKRVIDDDDDEDIDPQALTSIINLKEAIETRCDRSLTKVLLFREHTFVGVVNTQYSIIQHLEKLYIVQHSAVAMALMYQHILRQFGSFPTISFQEPLSVFDLVICALENPHNFSEEDGPRNAQAKEVTDLLIEKAPMLEEYFGLGITPEGKLTRIPVVLPGHEPSAHALPEFILKLSNVNWEEEEACFDGVSMMLAMWYSDMAYPEESLEKTHHVLKHLIFPALKTSQFAPPHQFNDNGIMRPIASLTNLYKIFERC
ncbi:DNA mismatch repair protein [Thraustotheca clavata]|uniref:DNA mismatch repair protein n=1 Tax=Thraustotheca clavata TaxID=74557 RepID=A0A1W0A1U3_9STRA|nr:DNA mismatch repair protein [Thraustotheca clavata]